MNQSPLAVCCAVSCRDLSRAMVLADSLARHHLGLQLTVLVTDHVPSLPGVPATPSSNVRLISRSALKISETWYRILAMLHDERDLALRVAPWLVRSLIDEGSNIVVYLDPDTEVVGPLDSLARRAQRDGLAVLRRAAAPLSDKARRPDDDDLVRLGIFDPGVLAASRWSTPFLDEWEERILATSPLADRWPDLAVGLFGAGIGPAPLSLWCPDPQHPPVLARYPGFDPSVAWLATPPSSLDDRPRTLLSEHPRFADRCRDRAKALLAAQEVVTHRHTGEARGSPAEAGESNAWWQLRDGWPLDAAARRIYREALADAMHDRAVSPPDPFAVEPGEFRSWLRSDAPGGPPGVSRYGLDIYRHRLDLRETFPGLANDEVTRRRYRAWLRAVAPAEMGMPVELLPPAEASAPSWDSVPAAPEPAAPEPAAPPSDARTARADRVPGVLVTGYLSAELGLGQAARQVVRAAEVAGLPVSTFAYTHIGSPLTHEWTERAPREDAVPVLNVVGVNGPELARFARTVGPAFFAGRRTAGLWFWELDAVPETVRAGLVHLDEVWVTSEHGRAALQEAADAAGVAVHVVPLGFVPPEPEPFLLRQDMVLPEGFLFGFGFDAHSRIERKNPLGLIDAFRRAFKPGEGPRLVIKTMNAPAHVLAVERVRMAALDATEGMDDPDITVMDVVWPERRNATFMAHCDAWVSLHRAEGYGLTLLEAMWLGKPVIATAWSGNLAFMHDENSWLVPATLVETPDGDALYPPGAHWAEPDLDAAAAAMREVYERAAEVHRRTERARADIADLANGAAMASYLRRRVDEASGGRSSGGQASE